jgi:Na+-driven multidrug efflux pump
MISLISILKRIPDKDSRLIDQLVLIAWSGVAVGCGWQKLVAYINVGCYYFVGIPLGVLLGFKFHLGAKVLHFLVTDHYAQKYV